MIAGILQPGYLPWLGFFEQLHRADTFVLYDDVAYDKNGWRNRNRIKTANGIQWLTVPVRVSFTEQTLIKDVQIDNQHNWRKKHLAALEQAYSKSPFFSRYIGGLREAYSRDWQLLADLDEHLIRLLAEWLGLGDKRIVRSSSLSIDGDRLSRLADLCHAVGADTFYEGAAGRSYIDPEEFRGHGIEVVFQEYEHPRYQQLHGEFEPYLSVIDLLFMNGEESLAILAGRTAQGVS